LSPSSEDSSSEDLYEETQMETPKVMALPKHELRNRANMKSPRRLLESMLVEIDEPESFSQLINSSDKQHWKAAMKDELDLLKENSTWSLIELPPGRKAISNHWIYRVKRNAEEKVSRYKAKLVIR